MKLKMTIEIKLPDAMQLTDDEERSWAENKVFVSNGSLVLHSNKIGEVIGFVQEVKDVEWIDD